MRDYRHIESPATQEKLKQLELKIGMLASSAACLADSLASLCLHLDDLRKRVSALETTRDG